VQVHLKMAICVVAGFSGGDAVLRLTPRQHGGSLPEPGSSGRRRRPTFARAV
jgi:hypothetical protein